MWNNSPFYITTNSVPDFREASENVERRISVFQTKALPSTTGGIQVDIWQCYALPRLGWQSNKKNIGHIPREERWYENNDNIGDSVVYKTKSIR